MSLDLGAVIGRVVLETAEFDRAYTRTIGKMRTFGTEAERGSSGVRVLDRSMLGAAASADKASTSLTRVSQSAARQAAAEEKAAAASRVHSESLAQVNALMGRYAGESAAVRQSALRLAASEARLAEVQAKGAATTRQLASAQAGLIGSQRALSKAQEEGAVAASRMTSGLRSGIKMAAELGLLIGAIEIGKKAIEFIGAGKELTTALNSVQAASQATDQQMKAVRVQALGLGHDLTVPRATAVDAAKAIDDLVRSGMTLPRAMAAARSALLLASVTVTNTAFSARVLGDALDEFQLPASQAAHVANLLGAAATSSAGGLDTVFEALKYAGSRARAARIPMQDLLASIVDLSKAGIDGSTIGTGLAQAIAHLATKSAPTVKALRDMGIEAWDAQGRFKGITSVVEQISAAQKRFGPNSKRFLSDLQAAFGARAGNVMAAFAGKGVEGLNRFAKRLDTFDLQTAANKMNRGLGAAMGQLHKQFTAAGIDVYQKLEPALATVAMWLGTNIPHAVAVLVDILGPTAHLVGVGIVAAWHAMAAVLSVVGGALSGVGHFLQDHKTSVTALTTAVIAMWAAYRGYRVLRAVGDGLALVRVGAERAMLAMRNSASGMSQMSAGSAAMKVATIAVGAAIGVAAYLHQKHARLVALDKAAVDDYTAAIQADNGALGENVRAQAAKALSDDNAFAQGRKMGIGQKELTDALMGNSAALADVKSKMQAYKDETGHNASAAQYLGFILDVNTDRLGKAKVKASDLAAATGKGAAADKQAAAAALLKADAAKKAATALTWVVDAHGRLVQVEAKSKGATDVATNALTAQTRASTLLKQAMDLLNGVNQNLELSTDQFSVSLGNLRNKTALATDANGKQSASLNQSTVAGATNRQMLVGMIDAAKAQAQATADQAAKHHSLEAALRIGNTQLGKNENAIRAAAKAAGMNKTEVDKLIASMGILSKVHPKPSITVVDNATGPLRTIKAHLDSINGKTVVITELTLHKDGSVSTKGSAGTTTTGKASGGGLPEGVSAVGEEGPELAIKRGSHVDILSNRQSKRYLALTGLRAPGFAGGTSPTGISSVMGAASGIASVIKSEKGPAAAAMRDLSRAVTDAFRLTGIEKSIDAVKAKLVSMKEYRSGITSTLAGAFDATKYGSVSDLISGLGGATSTNKAYSSELTKLRGETKGNKTLTSFINQLAASGQTATLQTLAGASKGQLAQIAKSVGGYQSSLSLGGNAAVLEKYGTSIAAQQAREASLERQRREEVRNIDKLVAAIAHLTKRPVEVKIGDKVVARAVIHSKEFEGVLDELSHTLHYGSS